MTSHDDTRSDLSGRLTFVSRSVDEILDSIDYAKADPEKLNAACRHLNIAAETLASVAPPDPAHSDSVALPEKRRDVHGGYDDLMLNLERAATLLHAAYDELGQSGRACSLIDMARREIEEADATATAQSEAWSKGEANERFLQLVVLAKLRDRLEALKIRDEHGLARAIEYLDDCTAEQPAPETDIASIKPGILLALDAISAHNVTNASRNDPEGFVRGMSCALDQLRDELAKLIDPKAADDEQPKPHEPHSRASAELENQLAEIVDSCRQHIDYVPGLDKAEPGRLSALVGIARELERAMEDVKYDIEAGS